MTAITKAGTAPPPNGATLSGAAPALPQEPQSPLLAPSAASAQTSDVGSNDSLPLAQARKSAAKLGTPLHPDSRVRLWDMSSGSEDPIALDGVAELEDRVVRNAYENALKVDTFFRTEFGRDGWDDKGSPLGVVVHTPDVNGGQLNNAYWDSSSKRIYVGDGDGRIFAPLGNSLDVMTHEAAHAVVDAEVNLRYSGQQGGINESWADVFAILADKKDWTVGEDVFTPGRPGDAIRDLRNPRFPHVKSIPPGADVDVHDLSGIPSLAAVHVADSIGREEMGQIWYKALTEHLDSRAGYPGAARATLKAARDLHGEDSDQFSAVRDAWRAVGVYPRYKS